MKRSHAYDATTGHSAELARSNTLAFPYCTGLDVTRHIREWTARKRDAFTRLFCAGLRTSCGCVRAGSDVRVSSGTGVPGTRTALDKMAACVLPLIEHLQQSIQGRATHKRALRTCGERSHLQQR